MWSKLVMHHACSVKQHIKKLVTVGPGSTYALCTSCKQNFERATVTWCKQQLNSFFVFVFVE